jgi:AraC-like DNA-binding protein
MRGGTIRAGNAIGIPPTLREFAIEPEQVLKQVGLPADLFDDPENVMTYATFGRLLARCAELSGCGHFGLRAGGRSGLAWLGRIGFVARNSPTVRVALQSVTAYLHHCDTGGEAVLRADGQEASLAYLISGPDPEGADHIADNSAALAVNILRELCGPEWRPSEVALAHRRPVDPAPYARLFGCPVRFGAEENAVVFAARWLDRPIPGADAELRRLLLADLGRGDARRATRFADDVTRVIRTLLASGDCSAPAVARMFTITERSLSRRLLREGTQYKVLLDEVRRANARRLLEDTEIPLSELAGILGYSEASAFTRAFRRWEGTSPARWRLTGKRSADAMLDAR